MPIRIGQIILEPRPMFINYGNGHNRIVGEDALDGICRPARQLGTIAYFAFSLLQVAGRNSQEPDAITDFQQVTVRHRPDNERRPVAGNARAKKR